MYRTFRRFTSYGKFPIFSARKLSSKSIPTNTHSFRFLRSNRVKIFSSSISQTTLFNDKSIVIITPPFADSIQEGDMKLLCKPGDVVSEDQTLGEIETDKTSIPIMAPNDGIVEEIFVPDGATVVEKDKLFKIMTITPGNVGSITTKNVVDNNREHLVLEENPIGNNISVNLPRNQDNLDSQSIRKIPPIIDKPIEDRIPDNINHISSTPNRTIRREKMTRMRLRISERLKDSQNTAAMLTTFNEVNMKVVLSLRNQYKERFLEQHRVKFGIMSPFIKATAYALKKYPLINAVIDNGEIIYRDYIDISVAISTDKGLVVPLLRNVEFMSFVDIENRLDELTTLAKTNSLSMDDLYGGTFTISNGGVFGSLYGTPIINPPQSAILGMHGIKERPVAINGKIEIMPMMYLALTYDHRLIDGREAVLFLKKIIQALEDPFTMLLNL